MIIEYINYPFVYTDDGYKINISQIEGTPRIGSELISNGDFYTISAITSDTECINGVCPIK